MLSFAGRRDAGGAGTKRPAATDDVRADEGGPRPAAKKQNHGGRLAKLSKNECAAGDAMDTDAAGAMMELDELTSASGAGGAGVGVAGPKTGTKRKRLKRASGAEQRRRKKQQSNETERNGPNDAGGTGK